MTRRLAVVLASFPLVIALTASSIFSATQATPHTKRLTADQAKTILALDTGVSQNNSPRQPATRSLGAANPMVNSRGQLVAQTWRDYLSNANMGRTVAVNPPGNGYGPAIQFTLPYKVGPNATDRTKWAWYAYDAVFGAIASSVPIIQDPDPTSKEAGTYPRIVIDPKSGKAIIGGQDFPDQQSDPNNARLHVAFDAGPVAGSFGNLISGSVMADSINQKDNLDAPSNRTLWPAMGMTTSALDTVIYLFAWENSSGLGAVKVFRKVGTASNYPDDSWTLVFKDTSFWPTCDFAASKVSTKVAAIWTKQTAAGRAAGETRDVDVWYADSPTGLAGTWTKHNLTNYTGAGYRAWVEANGLYDSGDRLHIIWNASATDGVTFGSRSCRLFHWSEYNPSNVFTVYNAEWDPTLTGCLGGANVMNVGNFSIGECDQRLYVVYSAWNDPNQSANVDDCAKNSPVTSGANGELYFVASRDLQGKYWSVPQNLSDSYAKDCDSSGNCADDRFASISEQGMDENVMPGDWSGATGATYDACGSYSGSNYIQVWYMTDRYPGGASINPPVGPMTLNDYRWIRLACNSGCPEPPLYVTPKFVTYPTIVLAGQEKDITLSLGNFSSTTITISGVSLVEDSCKGPGCVSGWLGVTGVPGTVSPGTVANATLQLNKNGVVNGSGTGRLFGKVIFNAGPPIQAETVFIDVNVYPGQSPFALDSVGTVCGIKLALGTAGNMGDNYLGGLNMNFRPPVECDTGANSRGDASIYLGDASPVIMRKVGSNPARGTWSMFDNGFSNTHDFRYLPPPGPQPSHVTTSYYDSFFSGTLISVDSLVKVRMTWYAPLNSVDSCHFIIQKMVVTPANAGSAVTNLLIGEAFDWDIPSDSGIGSNAGGSANVSGFDLARRLVWARGFNSIDATSDCFNNSLRYGGSALLWMGLKNIGSCAHVGVPDTLLYGGYSAANDTFVYPAGGFVNEQLWTNMKNPGYNTEPRTTDIHVMLTYKGGATGFTLPANDTLTIYTAMAVTRGAASTAAGLDSLKKEIDKARKWFGLRVCGMVSCCSGKRGNINGSGGIDLADLSTLVSYLTGGGFIFPCALEADVTGNGTVDLGDLSCLVSYLTGGGCVPADCPL